jgi:hypothetical protein
MEGPPSWQETCVCVPLAGNQSKIRRNILPESTVDDKTVKPSARLHAASLLGGAWRGVEARRAMTWVPEIPSHKRQRLVPPCCESGWSSTVDSVGYCVGSTVQVPTESGISDVKIENVNQFKANKKPEMTTSREHGQSQPQSSGLLQLCQISLLVSSPRARQKKLCRDPSLGGCYTHFCVRIL